SGWPLRLRGRPPPPTYVGSMAYDVPGIRTRRAPRPNAGTRRTACLSFASHVSLTLALNSGRGRMQAKSPERGSRGCLSAQDCAPESCRRPRVLRTRPIAINPRPMPSGTQSARPVNGKFDELPVVPADEAVVPSVPDPVLPEDALPPAAPPALPAPV